MHGGYAIADSLIFLKDMFNNTTYLKAVAEKEITRIETLNDIVYRTFTCELTDRNTFIQIPVRKTFDAIFLDGR